MDKLRTVDEAIKETLIAQDLEKDSKRKEKMDELLGKLRTLRSNLAK